MQVAEREKFLESRQFRNRLILSMSPKNQFSYSRGLAAILPEILAALRRCW